jgi:glycosyltransferase involved in cell wall biosynthesis
MQGKVSMVMPCYNKALYIGEMFDSIIAQAWDNIELILVNDGSTDGTRKVITAYEPKFRARGYEVVIVDQENAGVCAAAKAGLLRITGDYVALIDADDELDPEYVRTMAGWLDEHPEDDWTACECVTYNDRGANKSFTDVIPREIISDDPLMIEKVVMARINLMVWKYLVRTEYFRKCRIIETFNTDTKGSHEPGYIIPLAAYQGKLKYFSSPLYHYNIDDEGHSRFKKFAQAQNYCDVYYRLCDIAIKALPDSIVDKARKAKLCELVQIEKYCRLYKFAAGLADGSDCREDIITKLLTLLNQTYRFEPPISRQLVEKDTENFFILTVERVIAGEKLRSRSGRRIIGYGALGKVAAGLLPRLAGTPLAPTELWDIAGDGITVKKPDFSSLLADDLVLIFPVGKIENELRKSFYDAPCEIMYHHDIMEWLADWKYGNILSMIER